MDRLVLILVTITVANCDWVEIPQAPVTLEKVTKKLDFTSYMLTTTSTTTQTPIIAKPTMGNKKGHIKRVTVSIQSNKMRNVASVKNASSDTHQQILKKMGVFNNTTKDNYSENENYKNDSNAEEIDEDVFDEDYEEATVEENEYTEDGYNYANFVPYMSIIQSTLMKNAHNNKKSKVSVLQNLRDHLLREIQNRMSSLWKSTSSNREAREYKEESHVDFPSNEGALMTIGFLTFGVFLIKLVLQLIQTLGNNGNDNGTTTTFIGRKRRSTDLNSDAIKILNYIDQYRLKNLDY